jgi:hypothetical protein
MSRERSSKLDRPDNADSVRREREQVGTPGSKPGFKMHIDRGSAEYRSLIATVAAIKKERARTDEVKPARPRRALLSYK